MHIDINKNLQKINIDKKQDCSQNSQACIVSSSENKTTELQNYKQISFYGSQVKKTTKSSFNKAEQEKAKLTKHIQEILDANIEATEDVDTITRRVVKETVMYYISLQNRKSRLLEEMQNLVADKNLTPKQKYDRGNAYEKEWKLIKKKLKRPPEKKEKKQLKKDEKIDCQLLGLFKNALLENNLNFKEVFKQYYQSLNEIQSIEELQKKYPNIKVPQRPEQVMAKKIADLMPRSFHEELQEMLLADNVDKDKVFDHLHSGVGAIFFHYVKTENENDEKLYLKILEQTAKIILKKQENILQTGSFSSIPKEIKIKEKLFTQDDLDLLTIDYDKFVLDVIRKQYLEGKKLSEINIEQNGKTISLANIKEPAYKFEKIPMKLKSIISDANEIKKLERDYETFSNAELIATLNQFANQSSAQNDYILEQIINFATCRFEEEDRNALISFLKELDKLKDGEVTEENTVQTIKEKNIRPIGTEKLNEKERLILEQNYKIEQKKLSELKNLKERFDKVTNTLYANNLSYTANLCSKYRPEKCNEKTLNDVKFLESIVEKNTDSKTKKITNTKLLESQILRWDTFNTYEQKYSDNPIFIEALKFARNKDNSIDKTKAGLFILTSEIIENYPQSQNFYTSPEVLKTIMDAQNLTKKEKLEKLLKYEDYCDLSDKDSTYIENILSKFNAKDNTEKSIIKYIIENDYIKKDTQHSATPNNGEGSVKTHFAAKAKTKIYERYRYPLCIDFFQAFEESIQTFAPPNGSAGIKIIKKSSKLNPYKIEAKIMGYEDRLFSSNNDYYFDVFSEKGLH